ncbi:hypothetical protein F3J45_06695 [Pantoea sp. Ap-967]|uniref:hypothetical protein n=1 Tax=Pantoea sp. Ap-967 TaxID=2608362 RepID=UPI00142494CB|nr:hypothetical protein [Pantoea sp. Ap-967]NIE74132.1 hypothetical protein [Pantoea sp. Ap-967]
MRTLSKFASVAVVGALLSGCGDEDFTGAYRFQDSSLKGAMVLNIHGDKAEVFGDFGASGIKPLAKLNVSEKDGKLFLDDVNSSTRLVMKRNVDERSLDCLNCKVIGLKADQLVWSYDPKGPYDTDKLLKEQAHKREEALNAELEKMQKQALEQGRRDIEAKKLGPFEGDWVYQRATKYDPLIIMGIWQAKQVRVWSFKFETMDRISYELPGFEVTDDGLKVGDNATAKLYSLSADKKVLTCLNCDKPMVWAKADPKKDLSDRHYARKMAGNL